MLSLLSSAILLAPPPLVAGLDHLIIAVRDLEKAGKTFERLGFALKPGRPHENSIRNLHAKFPDGSEIELITASEPRDDLSRRYVEFLKQREGPIFFDLYSSKQKDLVSRLGSLGIRASQGAATVDLEKGQGLDSLFFAGRNFSPTDRPEHFRHANGANALASIWVESTGSERMRKTIAALGAKVIKKSIGAPFRGDSDALKFEEGELWFGPAGAARAAKPLGASVRASDLDRAIQVLQENRVPFKKGKYRILVEPLHACGAWIEFRSAGPG